MGAMKELALELDEFWELDTRGDWSRELPDGRRITLAPKVGPNGGCFTVAVGTHVIADVETLAEAIVTAGSIARQMLANQARTWAA